jgi:tetratricopeptide (TPR) repeat protein
MSQYFYEKKDWEQCKNYAAQALSIETKPLDYLCEEFAWGALPYDLAAISAWNLGLKEEAILHTEKALEYEPDNERLAQNLVFYKAN